jgi:RNase P subunit RPR2
MKMICNNCKKPVYGVSPYNVRKNGTENNYMCRECSTKLKHFTGKYDLKERDKLYFFSALYKFNKENNRS